MKRIIALLLCMAFCFSLTACKGKSQNAQSYISEYEYVTNEQSSAEDTSSNQSEPSKKQSKVKPVKTSADILSLGFDGAFLKYIDSKTSGNYMVSPLSFRYALGLVLAGANGETKNELLKALNIKSVDEWTNYCIKFNEFNARFDNSVKFDKSRYNYDVKKGYESGDAAFGALKVANSVWKNSNIKEDFKPEYKEYISKNYNAEYYGFTVKNAADKVNSWVNHKTRQMIPEILPKNYNAENLAVILANVLYYKSGWLRGFKKGNTREGDFLTKSGQTVKKQFMEQIEEFAYYADNNTQIAVLPMKGGACMAFVLGDTSDVYGKIDKAELRRLDVKIPKMDIETSLSQKELVNFLKKSGVKSAFNANTADFSNMLNGIWIDDIVQKTKIKTDEDGVEATASTTIAMAMSSIKREEEEPIMFVADKPFSFYIFAKCDGVTATLFAGKVVK